MVELYLAGNIAGRDLDGCNGWRKSLTTDLARLGIAARNPLRGKVHRLPGGGAITPSSTPYHLVTSPEGIVIRDLQDVERCDGVIVNVGPRRDTVMTGSVCEVFYAAQIRRPRVPVFAYAEEGEFASEQVSSPWFGSFFTPASFVHPSRETLLESIRDYYGHM